MKKNYVLDTNVLLLDPNALFAFQEHDVLIPMTVIGELNGKKKLPGEEGYNARETFRLLKEIRTKGNIWTGIALPSGGTLRIISYWNSQNCMCSDERHPMYNIWKAEPDDADILLSIKNYKDSFKVEEVILVTNDGPMQIAADYMGIRSEYYRKERLNQSDLEYTGRLQIRLKSDASIWKQRSVLHNYYETDEMREISEEDFSCTENQFIEFVHPNGSAELGMYREGYFYPLRYENCTAYGTVPQNSGQRFLMEALLAPASEIPLVIVKSCAGTGKTFMTMAAALQKTLNEYAYRRVIYTRANIEFDKDIGFLPGDEEDKISPLIRPCIDNLNLIADNAQWSPIRPGQSKVTDPPVSFSDYLFENGFLKAEALCYMRGRSIANSFLFVDEAQNCSITQIKGILTRPGIGTKVVIAGDPDQIDNRLLDKYNNGLSVAAKKFAGSKLAAQITLDQTECTRSELAAEASKKFD